MFDTEPAGVVGADYQRAVPLPDGRVLWTFQDAAVRVGPDEIEIVHNIGVLQDGACFDVLYGGTRDDPASWLFSSSTARFERWFWPLAAEIDVDGRAVVFVAEMVERGDEYLTRTEPVGTRVSVFDPATSSIVSEGAPPDDSAALYGWSITSDDAWTYLYAHCYRQFGYDPYVGVAAFDRSCADRVTVGRVPRGELLAEPSYWDGSSWQQDASRAAPVFDGDRINPVQVEWSGSSFFAVNKEGDWWGDTIYLSRAERATGPFEVYAEIPAPVKCAACNSFFATWIPHAAADRPPSTSVLALSHNRWDGVITSLYRPTFQEVAAPAYLDAGDTLRVVVPDAAGSDAALLNVVSVGAERNGHLTVFPCDRARPETSNVNYLAGRTAANLVVVRPDAEGAVCVTTHATTDVVVDALGALVGGGSSIDDPVRLVDTRIGLGAQAARIAAGGLVRFDTGAAGSAAVLNVTVVDPSSAGHVTAFPCDRPLPTASNANYGPGDVAANLVVVRSDAGGDVCLSTYSPSHLVVDGTGSLGDGFTVALAPERVLDTRTASARVGARETVEVAVPGADGSSAVVVNLTAVLPDANGFLTVHRCDRPRPESSNVNYHSGDVVANLVVARPDDDGRICVFSTAATDLVVDLAGAFESGVDVFDDPIRVVDTRVGADR
ncbi:MAG: hypothetical protein QNJ12_19285 [Ilumatobacter sp.]|uniref:hypothetical protein n=1 Tax=Ilumatobacter sp. TaxID=1967498 RepID=UPI0026157C08|nr:hypothetical protein [Ilumatobacter sp.]MDJ0770945.1 hypothetical protein [Ilumatobacter sp.]